MEAQGDSLTEAVPVSQSTASSLEKSRRPFWDAEQLRLAILPRKRRGSTH